MISVYPNFKAPLKVKHFRFSYSLLFFSHKMIRELLLSIFSLFLSHAVGDNSFKPTSGEIILANITYTLTWSFELPSTSCQGIAFSLADMDPPSYSTGIAVSSRKLNQGIAG